jgi:HEAT repeat protein
MDTEATLLEQRDKQLRAVKTPPPPPVDVNDQDVMRAARKRADIVDASDRGDWSAVRAALDDASWRVRTTALTQLARAQQSTADDLARFTNSDIADERRVLAQVGIWQPLVDLVALLNDPEPTVCEAAAWALGERHQQANPDDPTHQQLATVPISDDVLDALHGAAAQHPDHMTREAAVAALGAIGHESSLPTILQASTDRATVRRRAALALVNYSGAEVDEALTRLRNDRDWQVRQAAEDLLGND